jgi:cephalosporin-C deacetylase
MRRAFAISLLLLVLTAASSRAATLDLTTDRPDGIYRSGEAVRFLATLREADKPVVGREIQYTITGDAGIAVMTGTVTSGEQPAPIILASSKPEFFRCEVSVKTDETTQPTTASVGAGVEPEKITPAQPPPDDFDAFWSAQKQLITQHRIEPTLTPVKSGDEAFEAFDVQISDSPAGAHVSGYLARPRGAKPKSLPAILYPHSAGVRDSDLPHAVRGAKLAPGGMLALDFNAHGVPNGRPPEFYKQLADGELADHRVRGMHDREQVYFRQMYLRVVRALDFLT